MPELPLESVLITHALHARTTRAPNLTEHNEAFCVLSQSLLSPPLELVDALLQCALKLCNAGSAGLSLLDRTGQATLFRWVAMAGRFARYVGGTAPWDASPCGYTVRQGSPQLFRQPARHFACFAQAEPRIEEGLVLPVRGADNRDLGAIWIVTHTEKVEFDMEDVRVMTSLAGFAGYACHRLTRGGGETTAWEDEGERRPEADSPAAFGDRR